MAAGPCVWLVVITCKRPLRQIDGRAKMAKDEADAETVESVE